MLHDVGPTPVDVTATGPDKHPFALLLLITRWLAAGSLITFAAWLLVQAMFEL
jgi:hypothetical protein